MSKLAGKVAIVTGSSSGIGQAIAIRLASEGANIVVDYRSHPEGAADTAAKIAATGSKSITVQADVSKLTDTHNLVDQAYAQLGRCDILVNNAGIEKAAPFWEATEADYDTVLGINLKGPFSVTPSCPVASSTSPPFTKTWSSPTSPPTAPPRAVSACSCATSPSSWAPSASQLITSPPEPSPPLSIPRS